VGPTPKLRVLPYVGGMHVKRLFAARSTYAGATLYSAALLIHTGFGMATTVNCAGVYTRFEMGTRSGNMPV
jgi:hypothetical protein